METEKSHNLSDFLMPELINLEHRLDRSINWVESRKNQLHRSMSFIEAIELYDMGLDASQYKHQTK